MGLVTVGARMGGILAPFIVMLGDQQENLQFTVFGMLSLAAGGLHVILSMNHWMKFSRSCQFEASGDIGKAIARQPGRHEQASIWWKDC